MEAALDLESSAFGLGGSTPPAPTKDVPAWRNRKTRCIQNAVSSDVGVRCPRPAPVKFNTESWPSGLRRRTANAEHLLRCHSFESNTLRHDVHVRQIRLAAAVCKTATHLGSGGSNPLTCTKCLCFKNLGWRSGPSRYPHAVEIARSNRAPRSATSSKDRTPACRAERCEFDSRRSRQFRRCTLGWFGGCSFKALIRGFDSRHRRQDCYSRFMRISEALMLGTMKLEIIAR